MSESPRRSFNILKKTASKKVVKALTSSLPEDGRLECPFLTAAVALVEEPDQTKQNNAYWLGMRVPKLLG